MAEHETIADIIAEMRTKAECAKPYDDGIVMMLTDYADRIEAAAKRERELFTKTRKNDNSGAAIYTNDNICDAVKLHEALEGLYSAVEPVLDRTPDGEWVICSDCAGIANAIDKCKAALAAPPRNCDRFASAEEAWDAYDEWVDSYRAQGKTEPFNEFGWLYAEAKKGGAK